MRCPGEIYQRSQRTYNGRLEDLDYPRMETRKVHSKGVINWAGQQIMISAALGGWSVGVEALSCGQFWNVWFGRLLLGQLERATASFQRTQTEPISDQAAVETEAA
jgi:hypothetical protein